MGKPLTIKVKLDIFEKRNNIELGILVYGDKNQLIGLLSSAVEGFDDLVLGEQEVIIELPVLQFMPGVYTLGLWVVHQRQVDTACENAITIDVVSNNFTGNFVDFDRFKAYGSIVRSNWSSSSIST